MPQSETLRVENLRGLMRALAAADREASRALRANLRHAGEVVRDDAGPRIARKDIRSAAGLRVRVRQRGVAVEQSLSRTTGLHPEWGAWQMRHALIPALAHNQEEVGRRMEVALDVIAARFNHGGAL
jgi:hypothetical protein